MAAAAGYKISQTAKDFGLKNKDILDIITGDGAVKKNHAATMEPDEFAMVFEALTSTHQIDSLDDYLAGRVVIVTEQQKARREAAAKAAADAAAAEKAKAEKAAADAKAAKLAAEKAKAEKAAADKAKAERAAIERAKADIAAERAKSERLAAAALANAKAEAKAEAEAKAKAESDAKTENAADAEPKTDASEAAPAAPITTGRRLPGKMVPPKPPTPKGSPKRDAAARAAADKNTTRPAQPDKAAEGKKPMLTSSGRPLIQRPAQPGNAAAGNATGNAAATVSQGAQTPAAKADRPARTPAQDVKIPVATPKPPKALGQGQVKLAPSPGATPFVPTNPVKPKEKKQDAAGRTRTGATRVVDTRGSGNVDLSKYDESLDKFIPSTIKDTAAGKTKLKKQNNRDAYGRGRDREKERQAMEKMRRANIEKFKKIQHHITVPDEISVGELAARMKATAGDIIKRLMKMGVMANINQTVDYDTAYLIADEMGVRCEREVVVTIEEKLFDDHDDADAELVSRAPVVCVMGHVDHGKTSLLDAIRHTNVTEGEAGGITQHIGAYRVRVGDNEITFLDTPGHEAFTAMRARGAMATDIAILVVAADDGIMPQTVEAINHAKAAGVDIIVAINKMDKVGANPDAIRQELTKYELVPEEWGGDIMCVPVSAVTRMGIDTLLEDILLIAEVKEYKANPLRRAKGIVIEAKLDKGRGPVATVLVQNGTLRPGDIVIAGTSVGRVRLMTDYRGVSVAEAGPSVPVEIVGLAEVPSSGDQWQVVEDERMARTLADQRRDSAREEQFRAKAKVNLDDLFTQIAEGIKELNIIVKADVVGSAEAVKSSLERLSNEEVKVKIISNAVGGITEGDVMFAAASNAIIVGFNVRPDKNAIDSAERQGVDVRTYRVIYECIDEISAALKGMLAPKFKEVINGHAEVRQLIKVPNVGIVAGSYVQDGSVTRRSMIRVIRDGVVIFEDKISSLRRFKDDVSEVKQGYECGVGLEKFNDIKENDILEAYVMEQIVV